MATTINLQYPLTLKDLQSAGQHYILINSYESKNALSSGNQISSIALYIPPNSLQSTHTASYEGMDSGALIAAAGSKAEELLNGGSSDSITNTGDVARSAGVKSAVRAFGVSKILSKFSRNNALAGTILGAGMGLAVNNHMALVYRGPNTFRSHTFNFSFFPKNSTESKEVQKILLDFRNGMLPRYSGAASSSRNGRLNSPFFKLPRHYKLSIMMLDGENSFLDKQMFPRNERGEQINHVITNFTTNFDPQGIVSLHKDGVPVQINMGITFQETEFVVSQDLTTAALEQTSVNYVKQLQEAERERERIEISGRSGRPRVPVVGTQKVGSEPSISF